MSSRLIPIASPSLPMKGCWAKFCIAAARWLIASVILSSPGKAEDDAHADRDDLIEPKPKVSTSAAVTARTYSLRGERP